MAFPTNPTIGDLFTTGSKSYRWDGDVWSRSIDSLLTTANISENGSNLYYSNVRVYANISPLLNTGTITESSNLYFTNTRSISALTAGSGIRIDANGLITGTVSGGVTSVAGQTGTISNAQLACATISSGVLNTSNVSEGSNLYFTNTRSISSITGGSGISIAANGLITGTVSGGVTSVAGQTGAISNAQLACATISSGVLNTSNVSEGSNLYFTNTRSISSLTSGTGVSIAANGRITATTTGTVSSVFGQTSSVSNAQLACATISSGVLTTANTSEVTNLYFSNTRVQSYLGNISGALVPSADELYNLGSSTKKWANLFLSGNTIVLGQTKIESSGDGSIQIRSTNTQVTTAISFASNGYIAAPSGPLATASGAVSSYPRIANVRVTDSTFANIFDDTAANSQGYVEINGANFDSGATAIIGTTTASSVTYVNSTRLRVGLPTLSAGTYPVYVVNSDGSTATRINGLNISGTPLWTTASGFVANVYESKPIAATINAVSDSNIYYSVIIGSLPPSSNLNPANGYISNGNTTLISGNTVYNFTVNASDVELQNTTRAFSISVLEDVVIFNNTFTSISLSNTIGQSANINVSAINLSNTSVSYSSNSLANGLVLNSNGIITGVFSAVQNITSVITATAGYTLSTNTKTLAFVVSPEVVAACFLVVGGGGGATQNSGGGGGGGFLNYLSPTPTLTAFCVRVGGGGAACGGTGPGFWGRGCNGTCSQAGSCIAGGGPSEAGVKGGGGSGCPQNVSALGSVDGYNGVAAGGSGAGGQGNNTGTSPVGGPGCCFSPLSCTYAGGGGFSCDSTVPYSAKAGRDGGGNGVDCGYAQGAGSNQQFPAEHGAANRGGGGAGGWRSPPGPPGPGYGDGGNGGSGVVKILLPSGKGIGGGTGLTFTCNTTVISNCVVVCFTAGAGNVCITG